MNSYLFCDQCGFAMMYNVKDIWYLKCHCCDKVLVDVDLRDEDIELFIAAE